MRARYSAYALGLVPFILATTAPESPHAQTDAVKWQSEVERFCRFTRFVGLRVHEAHHSDDVGLVHFTAQLVQGGQQTALEERSRFLCRGGCWFYLEAITAR